MKNTEKRLAALGAAVPELLLPVPEIDLSQWAVIACDQFTQDKGYWEKVRSAAGDSASTFNLIYPEAYLEEADRERRIAAIHQTMKRYLTAGIFSPPQKTLVYVERDTPLHQSRRGLILSLDLETYDWKSQDGNTAAALLIRPTEGTVTERLPARMDVRRGAPLETPHILVLINDENNTLLPALGERAKRDTPLYSTELMLGSGRLRGWKLDSKDDWSFLAEGLEQLANNSPTSSTTAGGSDKPAAPFLYAVGDGNHSLATAKSVWEEYKMAHQNDPDLMNHPARWALVELENLYDPALSFEPIHRLLFGTEIAAVQQLLMALPGYICRSLDSPDEQNNQEELSLLVQDEHCGKLRLGLVSGGQYFLIEADPTPLAVDVLQPLLDKFITDQNGKVSIDYIHGSNDVIRLAAGETTAGEAAGAGNAVVGILLPPFRKQGLFKTIARHGPLPRKSFSMGESCEKRFYLECRKLF